MTPESINQNAIAHNPWRGNRVHPMSAVPFHCLHYFLLEAAIERRDPGDPPNARHHLLTRLLGLPSACPLRRGLLQCQPFCVFEGRDLDLMCRLGCIQLNGIGSPTTITIFPKSFTTDAMAVSFFCIYIRCCTVTLGKTLTWLMNPPPECSVGQCCMIPGGAGDRVA